MLVNIKDKIKTNGSSFKKSVYKPIHNKQQVVKLGEENNTY